MNVRFAAVAPHTYPVSSGSFTNLQKPAFQNHISYSQEIRALNASHTAVPTTWLACGSLVLCCVLNACATSRVLPAPLPNTVPDLGWTVSAPEAVSVEVDQVIVFNGGGSWVRDASWDEYVLTAANASQTPIEIQRFTLYSDNVATPVESTTSVDRLEAQTSATLRTLKDVGIVTGLGAVPIGLTVAAVGTGGTLATGATATAAAAGILVLLPVALVGSTVYVVKRRHRARDDRVLIQQDLIARGFDLPIEIAPGTQIRNSAFFPVTPSPNRLVVRYAVGGDLRELSLAMPALAGLHLKAAPKAANASRTAIEPP